LVGMVTPPSVLHVLFFSTTTVTNDEHKS
jgi:hypothetical protein